MIFVIIRAAKAKKCKRTMDELSKQYDNASKAISTPIAQSDGCVRAEYCCHKFSLQDRCQEKICRFYNANHDFIIIRQKYVQAEQKAKEAQEKYENTIRGLREKNISLYVRGK